jgi:hypothetical protein
MDGLRLKIAAEARPVTRAPSRRSSSVIAEPCAGHAAMVPPTAARRSAARMTPPVGCQLRPRLVSTSGARTQSRRALSREQDRLACLQFYPACVPITMAEWRSARQVNVMAGASMSTSPARCG